jgi:hypothetical protein
MKYNPSMSLYYIYDVHGIVVRMSRIDPAFAEIFEINARLI